MWVLSTTGSQRQCFHRQAVAGSLQSLCWASAAIGGIASAYFSGSFIEAYGVHGVFAITAVFPLIVSLTAFLITEERVPPRSQHPNEGYFGMPFLLPYPAYILHMFDCKCLCHCL